MQKKNGRKKLSKEIAHAKERFSCSRHSSCSSYRKQLMIVHWKMIDHEDLLRYKHNLHHRQVQQDELSGYLRRNEDDENLMVVTASSK